MHTQVRLHVVLAFEAPFLLLCRLLFYRGTTSLWLGEHGFQATALLLACSCVRRRVVHRCNGSVHFRGGNSHYCYCSQLLEAGEEDSGARGWLQGLSGVYLSLGFVFSDDISRKYSKNCCLLSSAPIIVCKDRLLCISLGVWLSTQYHKVTIAYQCIDRQRLAPELFRLRPIFVRYVGSSLVFRAIKCWKQEPSIPIYKQTISGYRKLYVQQWSPLHCYEVSHTKTKVSAALSQALCGTLARCYQLSGTLEFPQTSC